jgi:hypothetical protein
MNAFLHVFFCHSIYTCTYVITSIKSMTFDRFLGVEIPAQRGLMYYYLGLEPGPLKASKYSYKPLNT